MSAQPRITVTGKVTESDGQGIPGVSILVKGTLVGTITDLDRNYTIETEPQSTLVFSFVGFSTVEMPVANQAVINVRLREQAFDVEEVVVVGYGTQKVKDLTSSITTVKSEELARTPTGQAMQALQGRWPVSRWLAPAPRQQPHHPCARYWLLSGAEQRSPLYVVDGMFFGNIDFLNPADIASISVLKDASAAAIYGVRAANGVVLIETKSGGYNKKTEISYDGYYGLQVAQNVLKMANAEQFTTMAMESGSAADASFILNAMQRYGRSRVNPNVPDVNTDWYKEILRPADIQNHSINVEGGNQSASYSIGTNYFAQEGILDMKNEYERFNLRTKLDFKATEWFTIGGNMILSNAIKYGEEAGA